MSIPFHPPPYVATERIAHLCPKDSIRYHKPHDESLPTRFINTQTTDNHYTDSSKRKNPIILSTDTRSQASSQRDHPINISENHSTTSSQRQNVVRVRDPQSYSELMKGSDRQSQLSQRSYRSKISGTELVKPTFRNKNSENVLGSTNTNSFKKKQDPQLWTREKFLEHSPKSRDQSHKDKDIYIKHGPPGVYYLPTRKHQPNNVAREKPNSDFFVVSLKTKEVPENLEVDGLRRNLAEGGHLLIEGNFQNHPITNKRSGDGVMHVRAKSEHDLNDIKKQMEANGVKVDVTQNYKPLWKR